MNGNLAIESIVAGNFGFPLRRFDVRDVHESAIEDPCRSNR
jgi:hypothetical protein